MELLLNLAWLLLAMPAFLLWRGCRTAPSRGKAGALHCFLALGCLLVLLFPVVSATDDLRAMRAEMEESPIKRACQSDNDRDGSAKWQSQPAIVSAWTLFIAGERGWYVPPASTVSSVTVLLVPQAGRAPPSVFA